MERPREDLTRNIQRIPSFLGQWRSALSVLDRQRMETGLGEEEVREPEREACRLLRPVKLSTTLLEFFGSVCEGEGV